MSKRRLFLLTGLIVVLLVTASIYLLISNNKEAEDAISSTSPTPSVVDLSIDTDITDEHTDSPDIVEVLELEVSNVQLDGITVKNEIEIKLGQKKGEVEQEYGAGVIDSNVIFEYIDYGGIRAAYLDDAVAYIDIDNLPTEVKPFQFDAVVDGSSLEQIKQFYGTPYNPGMHYIEYYLYERDGQFFNVANYGQLEQLLKDKEVSEEDIKLLSIFADIEHPDTIYKLTFQTYAFVKTQL